MIGQGSTSPKAPQQAQEDPLPATIARNMSECHIMSAAGQNQPISLVIGVSGGADSVCLLHALARLSTALRLDLHVAHVNHDLRPEASEDARFVAALAERLKLPYHETTLDAATLTRSSDGLEAGARRARYAFLWRIAFNVAGRNQVPVVAVAHTMEDQAETLLLNLTRGSGLRGLGAMRMRTEFAQSEQTADPTPRENRPGWLIRPLLNVHRSEIEAYLIQNDLPWREDSSNTEMRFSRNFMRHQILPQLATINPKVVDALARTAEITAADVDRLADLDRALLDRTGSHRTGSHRFHDE